MNTDRLADLARLTESLTAARAGLDELKAERKELDSRIAWAEHDARMADAALTSARQIAMSQGLIPAVDALPAGTAQAKPDETDFIRRQPGFRAYPAAMVARTLTGKPVLQAMSGDGLN